MEQKEPQNKIKSQESRIIYVGDDTGLLKKVKMSFAIQEDVISMPSKYKQNKLKRTLQKAED
jgi:hypothetical protein